MRYMIGLFVTWRDKYSYLQRQLKLPQLKSFRKKLTNYLGFLYESHDFNYILNENIVVFIFSSLVNLMKIRHP